MASCLAFRNAGLISESREYRAAVGKINGWYSTIKFPCKRQGLYDLLAEMNAYFAKMQKENSALWSLLSDERGRLSATVAQKLQAMNTFFDRELLRGLDSLKSGDQRWAP